VARPLRLEFAGACWYVIGRSLPRRELFRDDVDRAELLVSLSKVVTMLRWRVAAYALLKNEYHLILETPEPNLSRGMRQLNGVYTQYYNRRHGRTGAVLHGRYKSMLVEKEAHLADLTRFVMWSPVRKGLCRLPTDWKWSSCRALSGMASAPSWLDVDVVLGNLMKPRKRAHERFARFVSEGRESGYDPSKHVRGQIFLGSEAFREWAIERASGKAGRDRATPRVTGVSRPTMKAILLAAAEVYGLTEKDLRRGRRGPGRKAAAFLARREGALKLPEIGRALGIREFSASHLASEGEKLYLTDIEFRRNIDLIRAKLSVL